MLSLKNSALFFWRNFWLCNSLKSAKDPLLIHIGAITSIIHALFVQHIEDFELFEATLKLLN